MTTTDAPSRDRRRTRSRADAGGPLLVAAVATAVSLDAGYLALAALVGVLTVVLAVRVRPVAAR